MPCWPVTLAGDRRQLAALQHCGENCSIETHQHADAAVRITFKAAVAFSNPASPDVLVCTDIAAAGTANIAGANATQTPRSNTKKRFAVNAIMGKIIHTRPE